MSDIRALLKAKREGARVSHPLASYTSSGHLRCIACETIVKHASSWEGHVGSKAHRVNAARLREEEQKRAVHTQREREEVVAHAKRKAKEQEEEGERKEDRALAENKKRRLYEEHTQHPLPTRESSGFPADFFSDASKAPPPPSYDREDSEGEVIAAPSAASAGSNAVDLEWEAFQQDVLNPPDLKEAFQRATIFAEPILHSGVSEDLPPRGIDVLGTESEEELTEGQMRQQKEQEERELILDRLMEEERAQEEADARVTMLKTRLESIRKQREVRRATKSQEST